MENESSCIKTLIIYDTAQEKRFTQFDFILAEVASENSVRYKVVKVAEGWIANRGNLM